jgi:polyphosphate kinase
VSDHIHVRSIVGRFLEHSRAWYFRNGGREEVYVGSADLMPRNLNRRVEVMVPLKNRALIQRVRSEIFGRYLADNTKARQLSADGMYARVARQPGEPPINAQAELLRTAGGSTL